MVSLAGSALLLSTSIMHEQAVRDCQKSLPRVLAAEVKLFLEQLLPAHIISLNSSRAASSHGEHQVPLSMRQPPVAVFQRGSSALIICPSLFEVCLNRLSQAEGLRSPVSSEFTSLSFATLLKKSAAYHQWGGAAWGREIDFSFLVAICRISLSVCLIVELLALSCASCSGECCALLTSFCRVTSFAKKSLGLKIRWENRKQ